ncbi:MAG TPA: hypothetical protein VFD36_09495 [Kofleriaceae bacterium]|nr:hypothetical protein [Kofleriaceae bacterium]
MNIPLFRNARIARRCNVAVLVAPRDDCGTGRNVFIALDLPLAFRLRRTAIHAAFARRW